MFVAGEGCADHFVCEWGRRCINPLLSSHPCLRNKYFITMFAAARIILFANGGAAPPTTPCFLKAIHVYGKIMSSPCLPQGKVVRIILFANGGGAGCAPLNPTPSLKPSVSTTKDQTNHVITMFAAKGVCKSFCLQKGGLQRQVRTSTSSEDSELACCSKCCTFLQYLQPPCDPKCSNVQCLQPLRNPKC